MRYQINLVELSDRAFIDFLYERICNIRRFGNLNSVPERLLTSCAREYAIQGSLVELRERAFIMFINFLC